MTAVYVVLYVGVVAIAVAASVLAGRRIAAKWGIPALAGAALTLAGLVLAAAVIAFALGAPGPPGSCSAGPLREGVAAVMAVGAIPVLVIALALVLVALAVVPRTWRALLLAVTAIAGAAALDWFAIVDSLQWCLE